MGAFFQKLMANRSGLRAGNQKTRASELTVRESLVPLLLVTILYFLWVRIFQSVCSYYSRPVISLKIEASLLLTLMSQGFAYGLLDTLNKHFQTTLGITRARSAGLQGAYFGYVSSPRPIK